MYHQYFGLSEAPFSIAVNPRYLFMSARHRDALAHLLYGVGAGGGFILLTGEVGTGKTTINRCLLEQLPDDTDIAIILNPALNAIELLASVCDELGIHREPGQETLKSLTDHLHEFLLANHRRGRKTVLMIDEAQHLDFDVLEQIRLLTNLETNSEKLLQIILIGQPELSQLLARPELRQLNQRITARYDLKPLNHGETGAYIQHRLQVAGMAPDRQLFPPSVVRGIHRHTRGIPRLINVLCDRILLGTYGRNKQRADMATLKQAAREVLGEQQAERRRPRWPWAFAALGVAAGAALLWLLAAPVVTPPLANDSGADNPEVAEPVSPAAAPEPVPAAAEPVEQKPVEERAWLMPPDAAAARLWSIASSAPMRGGLCDDPDGELACIEGEAATWDELAALGRPLLLDMVTPDRFAAGTVLLQVEGRDAWVAAEGEAVKTPLSKLAPLWTGHYRYLWHPPAGFERPLSRGDNSPVVAIVASLFARLDGMQQPLAGERFNEALQRRVMLFQSARGLEDDGVVGVQTLLELNRALGVDPTAEQARLAISGAPQQAGTGG